MENPTIFVAGAILGVGGRRRVEGPAANDNRFARFAAARREAVVLAFERPGDEPHALCFGLECAAVGYGVLVLETLRLTRS